MEEEDGEEVKKKRKPVKKFDCAEESIFFRGFYNEEELNEYIAKQYVHVDNTAKWRITYKCKQDRRHVCPYRFFVWLRYPSGGKLSFGYKAFRLIGLESARQKLSFGGKKPIFTDSEKLAIVHVSKSLSHKELMRRFPKLDLLDLTQWLQDEEEIEKDILSSPMPFPFIVVGNEKLGHSFCDFAKGKATVVDSVKLFNSNLLKQERMQTSKANTDLKSTPKLPREKQRESRKRSFSGERRKSSTGAAPFSKGQTKRVPKLSFPGEEKRSTKRSSAGGERKRPQKLSLPTEFGKHSPKEEKQIPKRRRKVIKNDIKTRRKMLRNKGLHLRAKKLVKLSQKFPSRRKLKRGRTSKMDVCRLPEEITELQMPDEKSPEIVKSTVSPPIPKLVIRRVEGPNEFTVIEQKQSIEHQLDQLPSLIEDELAGYVVRLQANNMVVPKLFLEGFANDLCQKLYPNTTLHSDWIADFASRHKLDVKDEDNENLSPDMLKIVFE